MNILKLLEKVEKIEIKQIPYWEIESVWPKVGPMLNKAIELQDEWSLQGVYERLINAPLDQYPMQLWYIEGKGAIVSQITVFPQTGVRKCLLFLAGGGDLNSCLHTHKTIEDWAKKFYKLTPGRDKMIIWGRRGWLKVLTDYKEKTVCMEKVL